MWCGKRLTAFIDAIGTGSINKQVGKRIGIVSIKFGMTLNGKNIIPDNKSSILAMVGAGNAPCSIGKSGHLILMNVNQINFVKAGFNPIRKIG